MNASWSDYLPVLRDLDALSHRPILIGRMAMVCFGSEQLTQDMDLVTPDFPAVIDTLYRNDFRVIRGKSTGADGTVAYQVYDTGTQARYAIGLHDKKSLRSIHSESGAELDIWLEPRVPYAELLADSREVDLGGILLRVPSARNMIRLKELALLDDPSREPKDRWDINFLQEFLRKLP